jgi:radical SAM protein with 4Fe4S-binding SPASM domain
MNIPINVIYSEVITNQDAYGKWLKLRKDGYLEYRKKWAYNPQNNIAGKFPLNLDIEPTNRCNLKCPFCYRTLAIESGSEQFDKLGDMSLDTFQKIMDQVVEDGKCMTPAIKLTHRGEPLLNPDIYAMVSKAKKIGALDVIMNTNATLLTKERVEQLCGGGLDKLLISIDSPYKELYEKMRAGASYDDVMENIKTAVETRNRMNAYGTLIRVGMVITKETAPQKENFLKLFAGIADVVSFNRVHEEKEIDGDGNFFLADGSIKNIKDQKFTDSQLWQRMTINWNGDAEICCENYKQEYKLGNVFENSIAEIWQGYAFSKARRLHWNGQWWKIAQCRKCTIPFME